MLGPVCCESGCGDCTNCGEVWHPEHVVARHSRFTTGRASDRPGCGAFAQRARRYCRVVYKHEAPMSQALLGRVSDPAGGGTCVGPVACSWWHLPSGERDRRIEYRSRITWTEAQRRRKFNRRPSCQRGDSPNAIPVISLVVSTRRPGDSRLIGRGARSRSRSAAVGMRARSTPVRPWLWAVAIRRWSRRCAARTRTGSGRAG
jgi:hypothetical protein